VGRYVVVRLYSMAVTLVGLSVLVFLMLRLVPGTVVEQLIGADAIASPAMVAELKRFFGLDQPWWQQYGRWVAALAHGDLGTSWRTGKPVVELILERLPVTIELTSLAVGFAMLLGIPAGILSATRRDQTIDNVTRVGTLLGLSVPVFWQGTMLILFFSIYLRWMPPVMWVDFFTDPVRNLTITALPALCLGTASAANIARTTRACMLDVLRSEYIRTAAAKGLADRLVVLKHALKNALIPIVTVAGLQIGILLGGTVVVEEVFTLPGIGRLVLWSIYQRDYTLTQSTILFVAVMFMAVNLAVDVLYGYLDPRIRQRLADNASKETLCGPRSCSRKASRSRSRSSSRFIPSAPCSIRPRSNQRDFPRTRSLPVSARSTAGSARLAIPRQPSHWMTRGIWSCWPTARTRC